MLPLSYIKETKNRDPKAAIEAAEMSNAETGAEAAKMALQRAGLKAEDIDIIICATTTPDQIMPSTGALIQAQIGAVNAAGMDVFAACSGFLYGLTMVESMIKTGQIKYALVIGAEVLTKYVDYTDRGTCVIFGDGAGAAVVGWLAMPQMWLSRNKSYRDQLPQLKRALEEGE